MPSREVTQNPPTLSVLTVVVALIVTSGCDHYTPKVKLGESPKTIKAKVRIEQFLDKSPAEDHEKTFSSLPATRSQVFKGPLAVAVTQAVLDDFRSNYVFDSIRKHDQDADLTLTGTIYRFHMASKTPWYAWVPVLGLAYALAGGTTVILEGNVDLEVVIRSKDETLINNYHATVDVLEKLSVSEDKTWESVGDHLDEAFTAAVAQIRDRILGDEARIMSAIKSSQASH